MSDNLRARIGAVQMAHMPDDYQRDMGECPCGFKFAKWSELASHAADAVIAELGLIRDPFSTVAFHRYVTQWTPNGPDWKADDE